MFPAAFSKLCLSLLMDGMDKMYHHHISLGYAVLSKVIPSYTKVKFPICRISSYIMYRVSQTYSTTKPSFIFCRTAVLLVHEQSWATEAVGTFWVYACPGCFGIFNMWKYIRREYTWVEILVVGLRSDGWCRWLMVCSFHYFWIL